MRKPTRRRTTTASRTPAREPATRKATTVGDLLKALDSLARRMGYPALRDFTRQIRDHLTPYDLKRLICSEDGCCDTWPYVCDAGCSVLQSEAESVG